MDLTLLDEPRELARRYLWPGLLAAARGLAVAILALAGNIPLFVLSVVSLALIPAAGVGFAAFPVLVVAVRWRAELHRRFARWAGVPIPTPYRPIPADASLGTWRRFRLVVSDPATWRDFAWLLPGALAGAVLGLVAVALPLYGLEGLLVTPLLTAYVDWWGYGIFWPIDNVVKQILSLPLAALILVVGVVAAPWLLWIEAEFARYFLGPTAEAALRDRVERLTETRADTVDAQAAELRRIERDLHDGAQARLVSLSMNIGLAEELVRRDPAAAEQLLAEARESSGRALAELRDLVRGIHPPVLAERGLDGAVRALALSVPTHVDVAVDLPARPDPPVESAAYFAVAEALANIVKHSRARLAWIDVSHRDGRLVMTVGDNGAGGADPEAGTGLRGVRRRLAAFDGTMSVSSPPGGPTVVTMELPCALSSPKTSPSSGTG
ncbi:sensor histidine kinase [Plantactinospora sp. GCM10030261]|uniref:sensor histidine kinase n=1 Tax=Plantactinospora sp. GCM10030261 TaxID=3273420 RepID=UPI003609DBD9